jgi:PhnB protein
MIDQSLITTLVVDGGDEAIDFYERAFGARLEGRLAAGDRVLFAALRIGDLLVSLCDELPGLKAPDRDADASAFVTVYCDDADALHARAIAAGGTEVSPVSDQLHGERAGSLRDPFGHRWAVATRTEELTAEEMQRRLDTRMGGS